MEGAERIKSGGSLFSRGLGFSRDEGGSKKQKEGGKGLTLISNKSIKNRGLLSWYCWCLFQPPKRRVKRRKSKN